MLTAELEQFLNSFPKDQQFRIVDPARSYWDRDRLEFTRNEYQATHFPAHRAEDEIRLAAKYTPFDPMKVMLEPAPPRRILRS